MATDIDALLAQLHGLQVHDISTPLGGGALDYPGDTPFSRTQLFSLEAGDPCTVSSLALSAHSGTHLDAPAHFFAHRETIDACPLQRCILAAVVVEAEAGVQTLAPCVLEGQDLRPGDAVLFKTDNSRTGRSRDGRYRDEHVHLAPALAEALAAAGASLVGVDYATPEAPGESFPVHHTLLEQGVMLLEGLDLGAVSAGRYLLLCLPLRITDCEASPVRAVLLGCG